MANHANNTSGDAQDKYTVAMGLLEPELKKFADFLRPFVPKISSKGLRRVIGMANAFVDSKSNNVPPLAGALLKQVTKVVDDVFLDDSSRGHHAAEEKAVKIATDEWVAKLFTEAGERIKRAADPEAEADKIKREFLARISLLEAMDEAQKQYEARKKAVAPTPPHTSEPIEAGEEIDSILTSWKTNAQKRGYTPRRNS